jgi:hypothetical protein
MNRTELNSFFDRTFMRCGAAALAITGCLSFLLAFVVIFGFSFGGMAALLAAKILVGLDALSFFGLILSVSGLIFTDREL